MQSSSTRVLRVLVTLVWLLVAPFAVVKYTPLTASQLVGGVAVLITISIFLLLGAAVRGTGRELEFSTREPIRQWGRWWLDHPYVQRVRVLLHTTWNILGWILLLPILLFYTSEQLVGTLSDQSYVYIMAMYALGSGLCALVIYLYTPPLDTSLSDVLVNGGTLLDLLEGVALSFLRYVFPFLLSPLYFLTASFGLSTTTIGELVGVYVIPYLILLFHFSVILFVWDWENNTLSVPR